MRIVPAALMALILSRIGHSLHAQAPNMAEIVTAQSDYGDAPTEAGRSALLGMLSAYQDKATVETVSAYLTILSHDLAAKDSYKMRESATAAEAHLSAVARLLPRQYINAKFVAAFATFESTQDATAMIEMAHVEGFAKNYRDPLGEKPQWVTDLYWSASAWNIAMDAYFDSIDEDHPSEEEISAILKSYDTGNNTQTATGLAAQIEGVLPLCDGRIVQSPKLRNPLRAENQDMVGAVIMEFDFDTEGQVVNPRTLASIPSDKFDETLLSTVSKWRYRATKRRDIGVTCRLERTNVVMPFVFTRAQ